MQDEPDSNEPDPDEPKRHNAKRDNAKRDERVIDLKGLKCPLPALKTRKALGPMAPGDVIVVHCTDPLAAVDIPNLVRETGDTLIDHERRDGTMVFRIRREARRA
jgi:tRNA 2-thiouridine synthesizing protein A